MPGTHRNNPHFVPNPEIQLALDRLQPGDALVLYGMGGVGKTQHAVQYAHEHRDRYSHVLWASADSDQAFVNALASLAEEELRLGFDDSQKRIFPRRHLVRLLRQWLSAATNWLLIIDNADSTEAARAIERELPPIHGGQIVITSRLTVWPTAFHAQRLEEWTESQSVAFLTRRLADLRPPKDSLEALARDLYGLPLALEHAAAYIAESRLSVNKYLKLLASERRLLLSRKFPGMTDYKAGVATTWQVNLRRLRFLSRYILGIASCFGPAPIPRKVFDALPREGTHVLRLLDPLEQGFMRRALTAPDAINQAFAELSRYSLIHLSEESFRMHPLFQGVLRDSFHLRLWSYYWLRFVFSGVVMSKEEATTAVWPMRAGYLLSTARLLPFAQNFESRDHLDLRPYVPHIEAVLSNLPDSDLVRFLQPYRLESLKEKLKSYRENEALYINAVNIMRSVLGSSVNGAPELDSEAVWFRNNFEEIIERALRVDTTKPSLIDDARAVVHSKGNDLYWVYYTVCSVAKLCVEDGDVDTARRLYEYAYRHSLANPLASYQERGCTRIRAAIFMGSHLDPEEILTFLEEGIKIFESSSTFSQGDVLDGIWLYAHLAQTSDQCANADRWLRNAIPKAFPLLVFGGVQALRLTESLVLLLINLKKNGDALSLCEETLRRAARPGRHRHVRFPRVRETLQRESTLLWRIRGDLLKERGSYIGAARSYRRSLRLKRKYENPSRLLQAELLGAVGEMFLAGARAESGKECLREAARMLNDGWEEDTSDAEVLAVGLGVLLSEANELGLGEVLLRRSVESRSARMESEDAFLVYARALLTSLQREWQ